jgi:hypothetical protein
LMLLSSKDVATRQRDERAVARASFASGMIGASLLEASRFANFPSGPHVGIRGASRLAGDWNESAFQ